MVRFFLSLALGLLVSSAYGAELPFECGMLANHYGPFDYRLVPADDFRRVVVERRHFTPEVESLRAGSTAPHASSDITYTLRVFPNHPRALMAMMNWGLKYKTDKPHGTPYTVSCWFERGMAYAPNDGTVPMIYGIYRHKLGRYDEAIKLYEQAIHLGNEGSDLHYNMGLSYIVIQKYDEALREAHIAYERGFPLTGLRKMLEKAGKWQDPPPRAKDASKAPIQQVVPQRTGDTNASGAEGAAGGKQD